ncbi:MAG: DUF6868 family protein [Desulfocapsaceae bacterium]|jgi:hypothetical protein
MDITSLKAFFLWSLAINSVIYTTIVIALYCFRGFVYRMHALIFRLDEQTVNTSIHRYLAAYKLLITFFNFTPWLVLLLLD